MRVKCIDSPANSIYKELLQLISKKGIRKQKRCFISGEKIVRELMHKVSNDSFFVYHSEHHPLFDETSQQQVLVLRKDLFAELDVVGTNAPLLCTDAPPITEWQSSRSPTAHELLCALGDPNNLGAVVRSACAFGIKKIVLLQECAEPFLPKVTKSSSGCNFLVQFELGPSIKELQGTANLAALDMNGSPLRSYLQKHQGVFARWLIGEEGQGVPADLLCDKISIPMAQGVESLNAAISASILLYELHSGRGR